MNKADRKPDRFPEKILPLIEKVSLIKKCSTCRYFYDTLRECTKLKMETTSRRRLKSIMNNISPAHECLECAICHSADISERLGSEN
jgi:hypothetical protein